MATFTTETRNSRQHKHVRLFRNKAEKDHTISAVQEIYFSSSLFLHVLRVARMRVGGGEGSGMWRDKEGWDHNSTCTHRHIYATCCMHSLLVLTIFINYEK